MFEQLIESSATRKKKGRSAFFVATFLIWVSAMTSVVIAGVVAYDARLNALQDFRFILPPIPAPVLNRRREDVGPQAKHGEPAKFIAPKEIPDTIAAPKDGPPVFSKVVFSDSGTPNGSPFGSTNGDRGIVGLPTGPSGGGTGDAPAPPPQPKKEEPPIPQKPLRVSSGPLQGSALKKVEPVYPRLAVQTGTKGSVVIEVVISEQGEVISVRAVSGHPLLRDAAIKAAWGWRWKPTTLNKVPVRVVGTITFNFVL